MNKAPNDEIINVFQVCFRRLEGKLENLQDDICDIRETLKAIETEQIRLSQGQGNLAVGHVALGERLANIKRCVDIMNDHVMLTEKRLEVIDNPKGAA